MNMHKAKWNIDKHHWVYLIIVYGYDIMLMITMFDLNNFDASLTFILLSFNGKSHRARTLGQDTGTNSQLWSIPAEKTNFFPDADANEGAEAGGDFACPQARPWPEPWPLGRPTKGFALYDS